MDNLVLQNYISSLHSVGCHSQKAKCHSRTLLQIMLGTVHKEKMSQVSLEVFTLHNQMSQWSMIPSKDLMKMVKLCLLKACCYTLTSPFLEVLDM